MQQGISPTPDQIATTDNDRAQGAAISRSEREDLQRLIRQREKVLKSAAKQRSAELLADFENQMGSTYSFDQDEVWANATEVAEREVAKAQDRIAAQCAKMGIPERFAPSLDVHWYSRGENAVKAARRAAQDGGDPHRGNRKQSNRRDREGMP